MDEQDRQGGVMTRWEYQFVSVTDAESPNTIAHLNEAGADGWEITGLQFDTGHGTDYLMKRELLNQDVDDLKYINLGRRHDEIPHLEEG